jgi:hypothetical protein
MEIVLLVGARPYILPERCAIELHDVAGLELDAATASKLAGHANPNLTMRV